MFNKKQIFLVVLLLVFSVFAQEENIKSYPEESIYTETTTEDIPEETKEEYPSDTETVHEEYPAEAETIDTETFVEEQHEELPQEISEEIPVEVEYEEELETFGEEDLTQEDLQELGVENFSQVEVEEVYEAEESYSFEEITPPTEEFREEFEELKDDMPLEVEVTTEVFELEYEGKEITKSKITIEVPATKETLERGEVLVYIPKEIASSTNNIVFSEQPIIIQDDPVVKWAFQNVPQGETKTYSYTVNGNAQNFKTLAVAAEKQPSFLQRMITWLFALFR